ncbi:MmgE/PrpD family protein [Xanthobacter autotrophicus DSM 431]|uniref:MmgE/PrpD family protein n=1 Tax=Xanthobacter nonsaccharivorans TaxID=3119912 RepID=UPI00372AA29E
MTEATRILATYAARIALADIPPQVVARAERLILDFVGNAARGGAEADSSPSLRALVEKAGLGTPGPCTVIGEARTYGPAAAALLNGAFGHSLDFDDTHAASSLHPSAPVIPAALAAAEITGASGADFVAAVIAGYEVCCRLGLALDPTRHYARGFHPTATAGTFGAAAAAGRLLGLDAEAMASAFGVAGSQAAGSLQFLANGAWNKRYQVGAAAMNGLIAAFLAQEGFHGSSEAIEGEHGFLKGYSDGADPAAAVDGLGTRYETLHIGLKPYPSCRYTHAALDGLIALKAEKDLAPADIERVEIGLHRNGITLTGDPLHAKRRARTVVDGQFSMPFTAAVALDQGSFGWDDYRRLGDPQLDALCDRIDVVADPRLENRAHPFGATLRLTTARGIFERMIADPSGEPDAFPDDAALARKFNTLAGPVVGVPQAEALAAAILKLSRADKVALSTRPHDRA